MMIVDVIVNDKFFIAETTRMQFFRSVAQALLDFNELNPIAPLQLLLEVTHLDLLSIFERY